MNVGKVPLPKNQVTVVLWVSINTSKPWIHIIENGVVEFTWHGGFRLEVGGEGSTYIAIGDGVGYKDNAGNGVPTGWKYKKWFHLGFTYDGSTARHYQDGKQTHTFDSKLDITKGVGATVPFTIGDRNRTVIKDSYKSWRVTFRRNIHVPICVSA